MGRIFNAIDRQIIRPRVYAAEAEGIAQTMEHIQSFYSQGEPHRYLRTGAYGNTPFSSGVSGGNGNYKYTIELIPPFYSTGTYSGEMVLQEAQSNGSGILGKPNTWAESEEAIIKAIMQNFS